MLCNSMRLQYPGPKGMGASCSTKFPQSLVQETEAKLQTAREAPWLASRSPEKYLTQVMSSLETEETSGRETHICPLDPSDTTLTSVGWEWKYH